MSALAFTLLPLYYVNLVALNTQVVANDMGILGDRHQHQLKMGPHSPSFFFFLLFMPCPSTGRMSYQKRTVCIANENVHLHLEICYQENQTNPPCAQFMACRQNSSRKANMTKHFWERLLVSWELAHSNMLTILTLPPKRLIIENSLRNRNQLPELSDFKSCQTLVISWHMSLIAGQTTSYFL